MPWKGVTVSEQRQRFLEDYQSNYYSIAELAERFGISRRTAHKWINRYKQHGQAGYQELSRRPYTCPWQTDRAIVKELVKLRKAHRHWGPRKLLNLIHRRDPERRLPSISTAARILAREGLIKPKRQYRRADYPDALCALLLYFTSASRFTARGCFVPSLPTRRGMVGISRIGFNSVHCSRSLFR